MEKRSTETIKKEIRKVEKKLDSLKEELRLSENSEATQFLISSIGKYFKLSSMGIESVFKCESVDTKINTLKGISISLNYSLIGYRGVTFNNSALYNIEEIQKYYKETSKEDFEETFEKIKNDIQL